jgi:predicted GIY-YIG superfamily endonuclease
MLPPVLSGRVRPSKAMEASSACSFPDLGSVGPSFVFVHDSLKDCAVGFVPDVGFDFRVYVLQCEGKWKGVPRMYCGIEHRSRISQRLVSHFRGEGCAFTRAYPPSSVLMVLPANSRACEAAMYYTLLARLDAQVPADMLGGWTQTSPRPSPLQRFQKSREHRMLTNACLDCGGRDHFATECRRAVGAVCYEFRGCGCSVAICGAGRSVTLQRGLVDCAAAKGGRVVEKGEAPTLAKEEGGREMSMEERQPQKPKAERQQPQKPKAEKRSGQTAQQKQLKGKDRAEESAEAGRPTQVERPERPKQILVGGVAYSLPAWVNGKPVPSKKVNRFRSSYKGAALLLSPGADAKTLAMAGFVTEGPGGPDLLGPGVRMKPSATFLDTVLTAEARAESSQHKMSSAQVRIPTKRENIAEFPGRNMFWPLDVLLAQF